MIRRFFQWLLTPSRERNFKLELECEYERGKLDGIREARRVIDEVLR